MSTVCRFFLIKVKEPLHQCKPGVGNWSIMGKNLVKVVKERPPKDIIQCTFLTWVATVSLLRSPPLLDLCGSDDSIAAARSRLARLLWHLSAKRVVTMIDIMSKSPTATTMAIRYSVRNCSSNTSCNYKKIIPIKIPMYSQIWPPGGLFSCPLGMGSHVIWSYWEWHIIRMTKELSPWRI